MSSVELITLFVQFLVVTTVSFVVICVLASFMRFQGMATWAEDHDGVEEGGEEAFHALIARAISRLGATGKPFCLGLLDSMQTDTSKRSDAMTSLKSVMRSSDRLFHFESGQVGMILPVPVEKVPFAFRRVNELFKDLDNSKPRMGVVGIPQDGERLDPLLERLDQALQGAAPGTCAQAGGDFVAMEMPTADDLLAEIPEDQRDLVDPVAGILREEDLPEVAQKLVAKARRYGDPMTVLCLAVEHLQRYQDHYGETGLNAIVGHVGRVLRTTVREVDIPARLPDSQFVIILDADVVKAEKIAERLVEKIRAEHVEMGTNRVNVTLNCGMAGYPSHGLTGKKLLQRALIALQHAARTGRGACRVYDERLDSAIRQPEQGAAQEVF